MVVPQTAVLRNDITTYLSPHIIAAAGVNTHLLGNLEK